jgi:hypothetical protein
MRRSERPGILGGSLPRLFTGHGAQRRYRISNVLDVTSNAEQLPQLPQRFGFVI